MPIEGSQACWLSRFDYSWGRLVVYASLYAKLKSLLWWLYSICSFPSITFLLYVIINIWIELSLAHCKDTVSPKFWKLKKVRGQHLICWSIKGFNFIQKSAHLHSSEQPWKNPAEVLKYYLSFPDSSFLHVHLSSINPYLSCQQERAD